MGRRLPPLNSLRAFEAAARHLSFTRAAEELFVTQAAISHQIKGLEEVGCDVIRCAVPDMEAAKALAEIKKQARIPVIADGLISTVEKANDDLLEVARQRALQNLEKALQKVQAELDQGTELVAGDEWPARLRIDRRREPLLELGDLHQLRFVELDGLAANPRTARVGRVLHAG